MPKFCKKPIEIEATQWFKNGDHPEDGSGGEGRIVRHFRHPNVPGSSFCSHCGVKYHNHGWVDTLEGGHRVCPGDWIITGIQGEHYPCKPDIFEQTYDPVVNTGAESHG